jgi:hypothetical protein
MRKKGKWRSCGKLIMILRNVFGLGVRAENGSTKADIITEFQLKNYR